MDTKNHEIIKNSLIILMNSVPLRKADEATEKIIVKILNLLTIISNTDLQQIILLTLKKMIYQ